MSRPPAPLSPVSPPGRRAPGVVVLAHVPPPHHGQSYAVQLLLERLRDPASESTTPLRVYHVDARLSDDIDAIGRFQPRKILRLLRYCLRAIALRLRHGPRILYYIPAAPMRSAVYRDWLVMALCRPFFDQVVFHWEAAGLGEWLRTTARPFERVLTHLLLDRHAVSVVLAEYGRTDAEALRARRVVVVPNGLPDPCPDFAERLEPRRAERRRALQAARDGAPSSESCRVFRALYLSLCVPEKGLFDALDAVALANATLEQQNVRIRIQLSVAGKFWRDEDRARFDARCAQADLQLRGGPAASMASTEPAVIYRGFVGREDKAALFEASDVFLFPSYYSAESFGLALAEAMAFGLPIIAARWRHIPELFPEGYPFLVNAKSPEAIAQALVDILRGAEAGCLRERFLQRFTDRAYGEGLRQALISASQAAPGPND